MIRKVKNASPFRDREAVPARTNDILTSIGIVAGFGFAAFLVMLDDIDFFSLQDLFDFSDSHHEHIVVALWFIGIVSAAIYLIQARRRNNGP